MKSTNQPATEEDFILPAYTMNDLSGPAVQLAFRQFFIFCDELASRAKARAAARNAAAEVKQAEHTTVRG